MYYTMMYKPNLSTARHKAISRLARLAFAGMLWVMLLPAATALESDRQQPIDVSADSSELDARTGFTHIMGSVVILQGTLEVKADDAQVFVDSGRVTRVLLNGNPATWKQQMDSLEWMDAHAAQIDYQVNDATILLTGDAQVNHPQGQITGDKLTYDLDAEKLRGDSSNGGRVKIRLEPDVIEDNAGEVMDDVMENVTGAGNSDETAVRDQAENTDNSDSAGSESTDNIR